MKHLYLLLLLPLQVSALTITATVLPYDILSDLNQYRVRHYLAPLVEDKELCRLASVRVEQIKTDWSHKQFRKELNKTSIGGRVYENLARKFPPNDVVWAWSMSTMGHREAMLIPEMTKGCVMQSGEYFTFEGLIPSE